MTRRASRKLAKLFVKLRINAQSSKADGVNYGCKIAIALSDGLR